MEKTIGGERKMVEKFLRGMYGGKTSSGRKFLTPEKGVNLDVMREDEVAMTPLLNEEVMPCFD